MNGITTITTTTTSSSGSPSTTSSTSSNSNFYFQKNTTALKNKEQKQLIDINRDIEDRWILLATICKAVGLIKLACITLNGKCGDRRPE